MHNFVAEPDINLSFILLHVVTSLENTIHNIGNEVGGMQGFFFDTFMGPSKTEATPTL